MQQQSIDTLIAFMNSHHDDDVEDGFASPRLAKQQLIALGLAKRSLKVTADDALLLQRVRDALNGLLPGSYVAAPVTFDEAAAGLTLELRFNDRERRTALAGATPNVPGIAARMLALAHDAITDGSWDRLKTCGNKDDCRWVFFDRSKNHSRVWCDMTTCGAEAKSRAFRARQRERRARAERSS